MSVPGVAAGRWRVSSIDPRPGDAHALAEDEQEVVVGADGTLTLALPTFVHDVAARLEARRRVKGGQTSGPSSARCAIRRRRRRLCQVAKPAMMRA